MEQLTIKRSSHVFFFQPIHTSVLRLVQPKSSVRIADNIETVAKSYEFMLSCFGWRYRIFNSVEDYLASQNVQIGFLILDHAGSLTTAASEKLEILEREIPIIFVSGHGDVDMAVPSLKRSAQDFMLKLVNQKRLKGVVFQACSK